MAYVDGFMNHYRRIRDILAKDLESLALDENSRIAIYGQTELAELAFLVLRNMGITDIDIVDSGVTDSKFLGLPVKTIESISEADHFKILIAFPYEIDARYQDLINIGVPAGKIVSLLQDRNFEIANVDERVHME